MVKSQTHHITDEAHMAPTTRINNGSTELSVGSKSSCI
jgi:hypothetical protein